MSSVELKWSGWGGALLGSVRGLLGSGGSESCPLADVTLVARGRSLAAHRLVLCAASALFRRLFSRSDSNHSYVILHDVDHETLEALLSYVYNGEVNVSERDLPGLVRAAESLQIEGLSFPLDEHGVPTPNSAFEGCIKNEVASEAESEEENNEEALPVETIIKEETSERLVKVKRPKKRRARERCRSDSKKTKIVTATHHDDSLLFDFDNIFKDVTEDQSEACCIASDITRDENIRPTFPCPFCSRIYHSWGYRRRHVKTNHETHSLTCKQCLITLESEVTWFDHVVNVHNVPHSQARDSLVIMVEAHSVLSFSQPPSPETMLHHLQLESIGDPVQKDPAPPV